MISNCIRNTAELVVRVDEIQKFLNTHIGIEISDVVDWLHYFLAALQTIEGPCVL